MSRWPTRTSLNSEMPSSRFWTHSKLTPGLADPPQALRRTALAYHHQNTRASQLDPRRLHRQIHPPEELPQLHRHRDHEIEPPALGITVLGPLQCEGHCNELLSMLWMLVIQQ